MIGPTPATAAVVARAVAGEILEVALLVTSLGDGWFTGTVLERGTDGSYRRTGGALRIRWPAQVPVFMGTSVMSRRAPQSRFRAGSWSAGSCSLGGSRSSPVTSSCHDPGPSP
jgi:hypothetical protein